LTIGPSFVNQRASTAGVDALDQPISIAHIWLAYVQVSIKTRDDRRKPLARANDLWELPPDGLT
jgi:hypothetical protein